MPLVAVLLCAAVLVACESQPPMPENAHVGTQTVTVKPEMRSPEAPPRIQALTFRSLDLRTGKADTLAGTITTSSNVASVELRTSLFSLNAVKKDVGRFEVLADVYDLPAIFLRPYSLRVIARNTGGDATEEDVPFRIGGAQ